MTDFRKRAEEAALDWFDNWSDKHEGMGVLPTPTRGFVTGASWTLKNLPRCLGCKHFNEGFCDFLKGCVDTDLEPGDTRFSVNEDFFCADHSELTGDK